MRKDQQAGRSWAARAVLGWLVSGALAPAFAGDCSPSPPREETIARMAPRGELIFASGARAVLDGLRWPDDESAAAAAAARVAALVGGPLTVTTRGEADRWGRSRIDATAGGDPRDLAGALVEDGLAAVDAGEGDALCRPALLAVEAGARAAGRGLWRAPNHDARDGPALRARIGRFVVAQGRVLNVGERPSRTYLDFARRGEDGLTVTVSKRTWRRLRERGLSAAALKGRHVRARGIVELWRGPTLDIASADMIEIVDAPPDRSASAPRDHIQDHTQGEQAPRR